MCILQQTSPYHYKICMLYSKSKKKGGIIVNPRKPEFVLTLIAGITGFIAGLTGMLGAGASKLIGTSSQTQQDLDLSSSDLQKIDSVGSTLIVLSIIALIVAVVLFVLSFQIKKNAKVYGIVILILSVIGFFLLKLLWIVPGVLGIIAGIMCLARKVSQ